jgi:filamentous hemagglutinin
MYSPVYGVRVVGDVDKIAPMNLIQNHTIAEIDPGKLLDYALNPDHDIGKNEARKFKARKFKAALGFDQQNADLLMREILQGVGRNDAAYVGTTRYGRVFTIDMPWTGPGGKAIDRTVWIIMTGENVPRLSSLYVTES